MLRERIVGCERCTRLRDYCARVAHEKKRAHRHDSYWGRPVPGFGDPLARVWVVGLAPAAHGANRTGRVFTGDGVGGSGDFLMAAMYRNGFANQPTSHHADDGLRLHDAYIGAACRCAPPDNTPLPIEIANCAPFLDDELAALPRVTVIVALGRIASDACLGMAARRDPRRRMRPGFAHGGIVDLQAPGMPVLVQSYHPSRQNTNTGRLTPDMLSEVFATAKGLVGRRRPAR